MNKIMLKLGVVIAVSLMAASAFAAATEVTQTVIGGGTFSPSSNVKIFCTSDGTKYIAVSGHKQGHRMMGGSNGDPKMYYKDKASGTDVASGDVTTDFSSGWSSL
jgi:hypothetical protein